MDVHRASSICYHVKSYSITGTNSAYVGFSDFSVQIETAAGFLEYDGYMMVGN